MRGIITADWHLRASTPRCRKDADWMETQKNALQKIEDVAEEKHCDVFVVGDIFHSNSDASFECVSMVQYMADRLRREELKLYILAGNHDLQFHSINNLNRSAVGILLNTKGIYPIDSIDGVSAPNFGGRVDHDARIVFEHRLVFPDVKSMPPNTAGVTAEELMRCHRNARWIFTGDYHHNFHVTKEHHHAVNPGCLLRQVADMKDYDCGFYYVDTDMEIVEWHSVGDNEPLVDDSYLIKQEEREQRIEDFMEQLKKTKNISLDFLDNVEKAMNDNKLSDELKVMIRNVMNLNYQGL